MLSGRNLRGQRVGSETLPGIQEARVGGHSAGALEFLRQNKQHPVR